MRYIESTIIQYRTCCQANRLKQVWSSLRTSLGRIMTRVVDNRENCHFISEKLSGKKCELNKNNRFLLIRGALSRLETVPLWEQKLFSTREIRLHGPLGVTESNDFFASWWRSSISTLSDAQSNVLIIFWSSHDALKTIITDEIGSDDPVLICTRNVQLRNFASSIVYNIILRKSNERIIDKIGNCAVKLLKWLKQLIVKYIDHKIVFN